MRAGEGCTNRIAVPVFRILTVFLRIHGSGFLVKTIFVLTSSEPNTCTLTSSRIKFGSGGPPCHCSMQDFYIYSNNIQSNSNLRQASAYRPSERSNRESESLAALGEKRERNGAQQRSS